MLLHCPKRAADGNRCQFAAGIFRQVQVGRQGDAVAIPESDFLVVDLVAARKSLVPFLNQIQGVSAGWRDFRLRKSGLRKHGSTGDGRALNKIPARKIAAHLSLLRENKYRALQRVLQNGAHCFRRVDLGDTEDADVALHVIDDGGQVAFLDAQLR